MKAAAGIQDVGLRSQVLKADTLSELVNLGGAYAALRPKISFNDEINNFFLENIENNLIQKGGEDLSIFLQRVFSHKMLLSFSRKTLQAVHSFYDSSKHDYQESFINQMLDWGSMYMAAKDQSIQNIEVVDPNAFFRYLFEARNISEIKYASNLLSDFIDNVNINVIPDTDPNYVIASVNPLICAESIFKFRQVSFESNNNPGLFISFDISKNSPVKPQKFRILIPRGATPGKALSLIRGLSAVGGAIAEILLDARPVAISELYTSIERLRDTKVGSSDQGCKAGFILRSNKAELERRGNEYAEYLSASPFDYGVVDRYGSKIKYDGLVSGTLNLVIEAKRGYYSSFFDTASAPPHQPAKTRQLKLNEFETSQREPGQKIANNCGFVYTWHFSNQYVADVVEYEWRNKQTPVYWSDYPDK